MQLHLLKIFSIVRRDEEVFVLILPCNCNESSHLHPGTQFIAVGQGPKFHTTLQQQCESKLKSLRLDLKSQFSMAALSADLPLLILKHLQVIMKLLITHSLCEVKIPKPQ